MPRLSGRECNRLLPTINFAISVELEYIFSGMNSTVLYPLFLNLRDARCVVVGLGAVGCRKLAGLLAAGASEILALDMVPEADLSSQARQLLRDGHVIYEQRSFAPCDALASRLVFAATSDKAENLRIAALCREARAFCNCATEPGAGDFLVPSVARSGQLCAALSTAGQSPALAAKWRAELAQWLGPREKFAWLLGRLRQPILELNLDSSQNRAIFRELAISPISDWLEKNDTNQCRQWLQAALPCELEPAINNILVEYANVFR